MPPGLEKAQGFSIKKGQSAGSTQKAKRRIFPLLVNRAWTAARNQTMPHLASKGSFRPAPSALILPSTILLSTQAESTSAKKAAPYMPSPQTAAISGPCHKIQLVLVVSRLTQKGTFGLGMATAAALRDPKSLSSPAPVVPRRRLAHFRRPTAVSCPAALPSTWEDKAYTWVLRVVVRDWINTLKKAMTPLFPLVRRLMSRSINRNSMGIFLPSTLRTSPSTNLVNPSTVQLMRSPAAPLAMIS